jgi:hypothetical protein
MPLLAFHPWEGLEQQHIDDDDDDEDDDDVAHEQELIAVEHEYNHQQEQLNRLQGTINMKCYFVIFQ